MKKRQFWTKTEVRMLATLWDTNTFEELQEKLKRDRSQIVSMAYEMRQAGFKMSKKRKVSERRSMLKEVLREFTGK